MRLNERQVEILRWIADGSPERDWPDWTHRSTAKALQSRGLVTVRGHGAAWAAVVTARGRRVLAGDEVEAPDQASRAKAKTTTSRPQTERIDRPTPFRVEPGELILRLVEAEGHTVRVSDPDSATRAGYRRALAAIAPDLVPHGKRVTYSGRDSGDLVIRLADKPTPATSDPPVVVPDEFNASNPLIGWLARHPESLDVGPSSRGRALRIVQGIEDTLKARGHLVSRPPRFAEGDGPSQDHHPGRSRQAPVSVAAAEARATFKVTIGDQALLVDLFEERERVQTVPAEELAKLRYDWQRAAPVDAWEFRGRLALRIRGHAPTQGWADRKRWTLESRLPRFVAALEEVAEARIEAQRRAAEARHQRRREWEAALPKARAAYLRELNRARLDKQLDAFNQARQLREYADAVRARATALAGDEQATAEAWAAWVQAEADRHDPTLQSETLHFVEPTEIRSWELDKYMPYGFWAARPPDEDG